LTPLEARQEALAAESHQNGLRSLAALATGATDPLSGRLLLHEAVIKSWQLSGFDFVLATGAEVCRRFFLYTHPSLPPSSSSQLLADRWQSDLQASRQHEEATSRRAKGYLQEVLSSVRGYV
jgi:hypothetical protein